MFYKHKRLANEANKGAKLRKKYGDRVARGIMLKLTPLAAFQNVGEVPTIPPFTRHKLDDEYVGCSAIDVLGRRDGNRIVFELVDEAG